MSGDIQKGENGCKPEGRCTGKEKRRRLCTKQSMGHSPKGSGLQGAVRDTQEEAPTVSKFPSTTFHLPWPHSISRSKLK